MRGEITLEQVITPQRLRHMSAFMSKEFRFNYIKLCMVRQWADTETKPLMPGLTKLLMSSTYLIDRHIEPFAPWSPLSSFDPFKCLLMQKAFVLHTLWTFYKAWKILDFWMQLFLTIFCCLFWFSVNYCACIYSVFSLLLHHWKWGQALDESSRYK